MSTLSYSAIISERSMSGRKPSNEPGAVCKFSARGVSFWYGDKQALFDVALTIPERSVAALIGPSGCGKSSLVKAGLLPRLSEDVIAVYVEATAEET